MKYLTALALSIPFAIFAEDIKPVARPESDTPVAKKTLTEEQVRKIEARRAERRAAGFVVQKGEGKSVIFYDMRSDKSAGITTELNKMQQFMGISLETVTAEKTDGVCPMKFAMKEIADGRCSAAIVLSNCGESPTIVACPEDKIGIINVDRLAKDASEDVLQKRLNVELWRISAFVLGGYRSDFACCMQAVFSPSEIDGISTVMTSPPVSGKIGDTAISIGTAPVHVMPYANAVRRGIAPAPTNDYQKAIWEKVKAEKEAKAEAAKAEEKPAEAPAK